MSPESPGNAGDIHADEKIAIAALERALEA